MLFRIIPIDWTVIAGVKQVKVYNDAGMTSELTVLHLGEIPQGELRSFTCYVRNEGKITTDVVLTAQGDPGAALVTLTPDTFTLAADESAEAVLGILVSPTSPLEAGAITVEVSDGAGS